ncbi:phosphate ABC transporter permease subunit PstC [Bacteroidota bacterium]
MKLFYVSRYLNNKTNKIWMIIWLCIIILLPILICTGLIIKSNILLKDNSLWQLLTLKDWKPLSGKFGFLPFIISSLWVTILALLFAGPICLLSSIHLTQYANNKFLKLMQPVIDILAGIPSVIYGVWGILVIVPFVSSRLAPIFQVQTSGYSIVTGSIVLSVMIIPFILNILIDIFNSIPKELQEASLSLGANRWYTIKHVLIRKAFPGIISAMGLGLSRAFGETIAVLMVVGNVYAIPKGIFQPGYPLPALIANNYGEMMSIPLYDSALMLAALILFSIVLTFNLGSRLLIIRYEKKYK